MRVLFQGDSVTDAGRIRENPADLGQGYPQYAAGLLQKRYPEISWEFINRGIGGNRTGDLLARWRTDCIDLQPDLVSILIGINDTWRTFDQNDPTSVERFEENYRRLLEDVQAHTHAKILMLEPFVLRDTLDKDAWRGGGSENPGCTPLGVGIRRCFRTAGRPVRRRLCGASAVILDGRRRSSGGSGRSADCRRLRGRGGKVAVNLSQR